MFESYLNAEILKAEKKRLEIFSSVLIATILLALFLQLFLEKLLISSFVSPYSLPMITLWGALMLILLLIARVWVKRIISQGGYLPPAYFRYTIFIEVFLPATWLIAATMVEKTAALIDSPVIFIYFVILIVSSLHLEFWISALMGMLISIFYAGFTYWALETYPISLNMPVMIYYVRSLLYLISGVCAGMVATELKRRLSITYKQIREKRAIESLFNQQVSKEVVEALKERKDFSARMQATILFLDIRDFTQKVQNLTPEEVNKFQNDFFSPIIEIINNNKGITNQITGDGLMATFGAPVIDEKHYESAWNAVQQIRQFVVEFRKRFLEHASLTIGIGMHNGEVLAGNIGNDFRKQFSVSGTPVIIASRIEQLNKELKSNILMSRSLFNLLSHKITRHESVGNIKMKGLDREIEIVKIY